MPTPSFAIVVHDGVATSEVIAFASVFRAVPDVIPGGDEPHYLAATQSLIKDGDLKVARQEVALHRVELLLDADEMGG